MKKIIFILSVLASFRVFANEDWGRSECLSNGGELGEILVQSWPHSKKINMCYLGQAIIELNTLDVSRMNPYGGPEANRAYRENVNQDFNNCEKKFGHSYRSQDIKTNRVFYVCEFSDQSWMSTDTINGGVNSLWNRQLNQVLSIF